VAFSTFLKLSKDWLSLQDLNMKLVLIEQQKLEAELKTLKGQLNPHFLFNSLNNIYSLALTKSDQVPVLILKLADLMRHIIYDSKDNYISLEKELEFVRNFIDLQKIRTSESNLILFEIHGQPPVAKIAPLIFEPFIDNAFKHGLPRTGKRDFIKILFDFTTEKKIHFEISNNFEENFIRKNTNSGIGLTNVKQRLKLLYTKDEYSLKIENENNIFHVTLILKLK
jgi:LytS/YehU family sensor histidine kinase